METTEDFKKIQLDEMNRLVLGDKDDIETLQLGFFIFVGLCYINVPLAFFYTTMFVYFSRVKVYNSLLYDNFIIISLAVLAYYLILSTVLQIILMISDNPIQVITYNSRFPLFYML